MSSAGNGTGGEAIDRALAGVTKLAIDTAPIIYFIEAHPLYGSVVHRVFACAAAGQLTAYTSAVTLTETLALPLRRNDVALAAQYRDLLLNSVDFATVAVTPRAADIAADLRARHNLRTPDALQLGVALCEGCQAFLTNDRDLRRVTELQVIVLADYAT